MIPSLVLAFILNAGAAPSAAPTCVTEPGRMAEQLRGEVSRTRTFGRGWLFIETYQLAPPGQGRRAAFETIRFSACLTWPVSTHQPAPQGPPMPYDDAGACPFEGCAYREWTATSSVAVLAARRAGALIAFQVKKGERVTALTGVVTTVKPGRVEFRKAVDLNTSSGPLHIEPGQSLYLLTYRGEGFWKAWFKRRIYDEVDGGMAFFSDRCERQPGSCDGVIVHRPETLWWVQIRNGRGQTGWTNEPERFDGKSMLGG